MCQYYSGDDLGATLTLQRVHSLDPNHLRGMDILAALYAKDKKVKLTTYGHSQNNRQIRALLARI
jgi:hypothetical protein